MDIEGKDKKAFREDEKNMIFMRILPETNRLTTDVFGNYVIQKFLESSRRSVFAFLRQDHFYLPLV